MEVLQEISALQLKSDEFMPKFKKSLRKGLSTCIIIFFKLMKWFRHTTKADTHWAQPFHPWVLSLLDLQVDSRIETYFKRIIRHFTLHDRISINLHIDIERYLE